MIFQGLLYIFFYFYFLLFLFSIDKADQKAKEAAKRPPELIPIFYKDYFTIVKSKICAKRDEQ